MAFKLPAVTFGQSGFRTPAPPISPLCEPKSPAPTSMDAKPSPTKPMESLKRGPPPESDEEAAKRLKLTVLAPFFDRIRKDGEENARLRERNKELEAMNERQRLALSNARHSPDAEAGPQLLLEALKDRGTKRKASAMLVSPMKVGSLENGGNEHTTDGRLLHLATQIGKELDKAVPNEQIQFCGLGPLKIMNSHPDEVLDLAHQKLHTWPYKNVPMCWRRLYEDASFSKAMSMLHEEAERISEALSFKRRRLDVDSLRADQISPQWLTELVTVLDKGITLTGAPGRASVFEDVLQQLQNYLRDEPDEGMQRVIDTPRRWNLESEHPIVRSKKPVDFEAFQLFINETAAPIIIPGLMDAWPAISLWRNPSYLMRITLGGRRLVPVEVGKSYLDADWSQKMMPFKDFMKEYLLPSSPKETGYLAQHDLFAQIPALRNDIAIPDYCYTSPPPPSEAAARTAGLASARQLDEPMLNAWFGPKGTRTPLHTDPYHNILCQVVGYKYVRLYAPPETPKVYPCGEDDDGIDMSNTSQVDVSHWCTHAWDDRVDLDVQRAEHLRFPLFGQAEFVEGILGPGESLYIPLGWWHYVEGLSTSFSVSFWWN